jgi:hypothetical protein
MTTIPTSPRFSGRSALALIIACPLLTVLSPSLSAQTAAADASPPVFSEDFESGTLNPKVWQLAEYGDVDISVQQSQVAHGKSALLVHTAKGANRAFASIVATHLPDSVRKHFFGRAYMFISPDMPAGHDALLSAGRPGWPLSDFLEIGASGGKNPMVSYQQNAPLPVIRGEDVFADKGPPAYPVGRWFCLEWEFNDQPDTMTVWIDGEKVREAPSLNNSFQNRPRNPAAKGGPAAKGDAAPAAPAAAPAAVPTPKFEVKTSDLTGGFYDFAFGFRYWGTPKTDYDIYYDDIAIDTKRIGPVK